MRRDMELVRQILLRLEELTYPDALEASDFPGKDPREVLEHCISMDRAGLIEQYQPNSSNLGCARISWAGYDFLDAARNETVWRRVWGPLRDAGQTLPLEALKAVLVEAAKRWGMEAVFGPGSTS